MAVPGATETGIDQKGEKKMKTKRFFLMAATFVAGMAAMISCENNIEPEKQEVVEGPVLLTAEGFTSSTATKTSVQGSTVQWENGDVVNLNGTDYSITVNGDQASVSASLTVGDPVYGYYGCTATNGQTTTPSVSIPSAYACNINEAGRQVIALPMAAYSASAGNTIKFMHLTAAVNVTIWNATTSTLFIDAVTITADEYRLNGERTLNLTAADYGITTDNTSVPAENRTVTVSFATPLEIEPGETNTKSVQVPILPIGDDNITINVTSHNAHYDGVSVTNQTHTFNYTAGAAALGRNYMLSAKVKMDPRSANVSSNGVFSVSATKAVYFSQGNLQFCANVTNAENPPYTREWKFAETDYSLISYVMEPIGEHYFSESSTYWMDLFGYGASGFDNGQEAYEPWASAATTNENYPADYTYYIGNLTGSADWGYNAISNGGNTVNSGWRTLSADEWDYVCNERTGDRFVPAKIEYTGGSRLGFILFPDNWSRSNYPTELQHYNDVDGTKNDNTITSSDWATYFVANGAVFLGYNNYKVTATGEYSWRTYTVESSSSCVYWTSTWGINTGASGFNKYMPLIMSSYNMKTQDIHPSRIGHGRAVRLVRDAN